MSSPEKNSNPKSPNAIANRAELERLLRVNPDQFWSVVDSWGERVQMAEANAALKDQVIEQKEKIISHYREALEKTETIVEQQQRTIVILKDQVRTKDETIALKDRLIEQEQSIADIAQQIVTETTEQLTVKEAKLAELAKQIERLKRKVQLETVAMGNEKITLGARITTKIAVETLERLMDESPTADGFQPLTGSELSRRTGIARPTIVTHMQQLVKARVFEVDKRPASKAPRDGRLRKPVQLENYYRFPGGSSENSYRALIQAAPMLVGLEQLTPDRALTINPEEIFPLTAEEIALGRAPGGADVINPLSKVCAEHDGKIAFYKVAWCLGDAPGTGHYLTGYLEPIRKPARPRRKQSAFRFARVSEKQTHERSRAGGFQNPTATEAQTAQNPRQGAPVALSKQ